LLKGKVSGLSLLCLIERAFEVANFDLGNVAVFIEIQDSRGVRGIEKSRYRGKCYRRYRWALEAVVCSAI
jgi:hypothetical protein